MNLEQEKQVQILLKKLGLKPKRKLGQHFMVDRSVLEGMVESAKISSEDEVLEVGAGLGILTELLSSKAKHVYAIELDRILYSYLLGKFKNLNNVTLILGDALKISFPTFNKVVSNLPFSISTEFTIRLLSKYRHFQLAVLTYQKEVALRMIACPGSENYGRLSVVVQLFSDVYLLREVSRNSFYPPPEVDAMVVLLKPKASFFFSDKDFKLFTTFTALLFSQRRKVVEKAIKTVLSKVLKVKMNGVFIERALKDIMHKRVFELSPQEVLSLYKELRSFINEGN